MLRKFLVPVLALVALMSLPSVSHAQFKQGDFVFTLAGNGMSNKSFSQSSVGVNGSIGYFLTQNVELSLRQGFGYANSVTSGSTQLAADWVFAFGKLAPYVGVNGGMSYSTKSIATTEFGPEAGIRYFLIPSTFIFAQAEWDISVANTSKSEIMYTAGLGVRLN